MIVQCGITPEKITELKENELFVFGSNRAGIHGAGAAYTAERLFDAERGVGEGITGSCYAFPTKDEDIITLDNFGLAQSIVNLEQCVRDNPDKHFLITKVGCGLAGIPIQLIGRMFRFFIMENYKNVSFPYEFLRANRCVAESEVEQMAIADIRSRWLHLYDGNKFSHKRPFPSYFWKEIDSWVRGFKKGLDENIWKGSCL